MADTKREIERKFEFSKAGEARPEMPDLAGTAAIAAVRDQGTVELDAVYYDTPDGRLAADGITLRRRTGGEDAGWHLKLPVSAGVRDEIGAEPGDTLPPSLASLVRSRVRGDALEPRVRLLTSRRVSHLLDADGAVLAELCADDVLAERDGATAAWTEVEVELADGTDPKLLDAVGKTFRKAGLRVSDAPSKLARALAETGFGEESRTGAGAAGGTGAAETAPADRPATAAVPDGTAAAHVLAYLREQRDALVAQDPAVRRGLPDSVHQMRVATRRLRSAFKTYRKVLDREVTDPLGEELRLLASELGVERDQEVLHKRIATHLDELPDTLVLGPAPARLRIWDAAAHADSRRRTLAHLDSERHLRLLDGIDALLADPPLRKAAIRPAENVLPQAVLRDYDRLADRLEGALAQSAGHERDLALHAARKAAKRARYAAEAAVPALGKPAKHLAKAVKTVQTLLGDHQDSVVARDALRALAAQADGAGESAFTWGLLHAREEALAQRYEEDLSDVWDKAASPRLRAALR
ncbi:metal-binding protein [Streptomyces sp. CB00455]|uniref:CYTH and CHAD domain-containing protein n=1 Tax=Streptomyces sp. CB00455 TaxID=1703927 RepID=UPI00093C7421|nr:CYTH and CHAD domain-containing protein [Streptomyces sp. CB00455]OKK19527.1 metal-binding protein [Streptomyces sp. CB00455]